MSASDPRSNDAVYAEASGAGAPRPDRAPTPVTIEDVRAAAARLRGVAHRTPLLTSRGFDAHLGQKVRVFFKCENLQRVGAFKFRGAYNALSLLDDARRRRGVITYSSGNHAQATALAGRLLRIPSIIIMPDNAPRAKYEATRSYIDPSLGSEIVLYNPEATTREELGRRIAAERGLTLVKPYDNPYIIAGQATATLELFEQMREAGGASREPSESSETNESSESIEPDLILAPCGGGGLLSGTAMVAKALCPSCCVIGVEPSAADDAFRSFRDRALRAVHNPSTIADGARTPSLGHWTFPLIREHVDAMMTVPDEDLIAAMRMVMERLKIVIEPTAALPIAGLMRLMREPDSLVDGRDFTGRPVSPREGTRIGVDHRDTPMPNHPVSPREGTRIGVIVSGGNVDPERLGAILRLEA